MMKRILMLAVVGSGALCCVPIADAQMITMIDNTSQYSYGDGGEFRAIGDLALNSVIDWNAYSPGKTTGNVTSGDSGSWGYSKSLFGEKYFQTFCTEIAEEFTPGDSYSVTSIGNNALYAGTGKPVPITLGVAYLYSQFAAGTLAGYDYTYGGGRSTTAGALQEAIWYLLGESGDGAALPMTGPNSWVYNDLLNSGITGSWKAPADGAYGVGDMTLNAPGQAQDQLVMVAVPEPSTMIAGALMLLPFGASTMRILRRKNSAQ
ncbi:MAG: hypothetical protein ACLQVY_15970 [Limisphaerales bacterium]